MAHIHEAAAHSAATNSSWGVIRRLTGALLIAVFFAPIRAETAPEETAPQDVCTWQVKYRENIGYEATLDSELVREMLAQPIEENFSKAEYARWILEWTHRCEEARLLRNFMERSVVAELLGMPANKAKTVAEAISQQRAQPTPVSQETLHLAWGKHGTEELSRYEAAKGILFRPPELHFGYPANRHDSPRSLATRRISASTCLERGACGYLSYFWKKGYVQYATSTYGYYFAYPALVIAAIINLVFRRRTASQVAFALSRLTALIAAIHLLTVSVHVWSMKFTYGEGAATGVVIVYFFEKGIAIAIAFVAVALMALASRGSRAVKSTD